MTDINQVVLSYSCPVCSGKLYLEGDAFICSSKHVFFVKEGIADFTSPDIFSPPIYDDPEHQKWVKVSTELLLNSYKSGSLFERIQDYGHSFLESIADGNNNWKLDLGCGFGRHFDFLKDKKSVVGLDLNLKSLKVASTNNPGSVFIKGHMEKLPFSEGFFSIIYAIYSLEHVYNLEAVTREIKRILTKDGQLLVGLPAEGGLLYNGIRKITIIPYLSKKYNITYEKVVKIEHCNTAKKVMMTLKSEFKKERIKYYPFGIRSLDTNLIVLASFRNEYK